MVQGRSGVECLSRVMARPLPLLLVLGLFLAAPLAAQPADEADRAYNRGMALLEAGKLEEAAREFEKVLEYAERAFGPDDPRLAVDLNNLGEVYRRMGRLDRASELLRRAIRLDEAAGGRGPALATSLNNLGLVLHAEGRLEAAADLYRRAIYLLESSIGPDHPDTARALNNLAQVELARGDTRTALMLQERAARIARDALGANHATTLAIEAALRRTRAAAGSAAATAPPPPGTSTGAPPLSPETGRAGRLRAPAPAPRDKPAAEPSASPAPVGPDATRSTAVASADPASSRGGVRLHLGSIGDPSRLEAEWQRLKGRHPSLAGLGLLPAERVEIAGRGTFWRVLAGPVASRETGARICAEISGKGDPCAVLGP